MDHLEAIKQLKARMTGMRIKTLTLTRLRVDVSGPGSNDGRADP